MKRFKMHYTPWGYRVGTSALSKVNDFEKLSKEEQEGYILLAIYNLEEKHNKKGFSEEEITEEMETIGTEEDIEENFNKKFLIWNGKMGKEASFKISATGTKVVETIFKKRR